MVWILLKRHDRETFIEYFHRELRYLRNAGADFALQHPKIARRLDLRQLGESPDPHVERLLESFAFLSARLSKDIDDRMPELAAALLETLYPQLMVPIPSATIARRSKPSLRKSAKMSSMSSTTLSSQRPSLASRRFSTTRCESITRIDER